MSDRACVPKRAHTARQHRRVRLLLRYLSWQEAYQNDAQRAVHMRIERMQLRIRRHARTPQLHD